MQKKSFELYLQDVKRRQGNLSVADYSFDYDRINNSQFGIVTDRDN